MNGVYLVLHTCGHKFQHDLDGRSEQHLARIAQQTAGDACPPCVTRSREEQITADRRRFTADALAQQLPTLDGTPKQVIYATTIRGRFLEQLPDRLGGLTEWAGGRGRQLAATDKALALVRELALEQTTAVWWILNRSVLGRSLLREGKVPHRLKQAGEVGDTARSLLTWIDR